MPRLTLRPGLALVLALLAGGCRKPEPLEVVRARATRDFLHQQLVGLDAMIGKAERGDLVRKDQLAIAVHEDALAQILNASLPRESQLGGGVRIRIDKATPLFRGSQAAMVFEAQASMVSLPDVAAGIELGGRLDDLSLAGGKLTARVALERFVVLETPGGALARNLLEEAGRRGLPVIEESLFPVEIPVRLEEAVRIRDLDEGPVRGRGGVLPLRMSIGQVIPISSRLWVLIDVEAGPWQAGAPEPKKPR